MGQHAATPQNDDFDFAFKCLMAGPDGRARFLALWRRRKGREFGLRLETREPLIIGSEPPEPETTLYPLWRPLPGRRRAPPRFRFQTINHRWRADEVAARTWRVVGALGIELRRSPAYVTGAVLAGFSVSWGTWYMPETMRTALAIAPTMGVIPGIGLIYLPLFLGSLALGLMLADTMADWGRFLQRWVFPQTRRAPR